VTRSCSLAALTALSVAAATAAHAQPVAKDRPAMAAAGSLGATPTAAAAKVFVDSVEKRLNALSIEANQAGWVAATYITDDTEALSARAQEALNVATQRFALTARRYDGVSVPPDLRRKLNLIKLALTAPPPGDPAKASELTRLTVGMEGEYGKGAYCRRGPLGAPAGAAGDSACYQINELSRALATSRDPAVLLDAWRGWHAVGAPIRPKYQRFAELSNQGARELGFTDLGAMWRSNYDMPADQFPRPRRDVALRLRHAGRPVPARPRAAVEAGGAALRVAARLRAHAAQPAVRRRGRVEGRDDPRAPSPSRRRSSPRAAP
jgi:peptidyl-dipeptidase A